MPTIPDYQSKELPHANIEAAKIPLSYAHLAPSAAMERMGGEIANIGTQWADKINHAEAGAELAKSIAGATMELGTSAQRIMSNADLVEGKPGATDWKGNPDAAKEYYDQTVKDVEQRFRPKNDLARKLYDSKFPEHAMHHSLALNDWAIKTKVGKIVGDYNQAINAHLNASISATDNDTFILNSKYAIGAIRAKEQAGGITHDESVKEEHKFVNAALKGRIENKIYRDHDPEGALRDLDDPNGPYSELKNKDGQTIWLGLDETVKKDVRKEAEKHSTAMMHENRVAENQAEKKRISATNTAAVDELKKTWNLKPGAPIENWQKALADANDTKWQEEHGLLDQEKQRAPVYNTIKNLMAQAQKEANDKKKDTNERFYQGRREGKIKPDQYGSYIDKETGLPPSETAIQHAQYLDGQGPMAKVTPRDKYAAIKHRITDADRDDRITDIGDLHKATEEAHIRESDEVKLERLLKTNMDPKKHAGFNLAMKHYDEVHKKDKNKLLKNGTKKDIINFNDKRDSFEESLVQGIHEGKLNNPSDIRDKAEELMKKEIYKATPTGKAESAATQAEHIVQHRKPLPSAKAKDELPKPTDRHKETGAPVYTLPDGTKVADTKSKPELVAADSETGEPIFQHDDGTMYSVGKGGDIHENQIGTPDLPESKDEPDEEELEDKAPSKDDDDEQEGKIPSLDDEKERAKEEAD